MTVQAIATAAEVDWNCKAKAEPRAAAEIVNDHVRRGLHLFVGEIDPKKRLPRGQYTNLLVSMTKAASDHALGTDMDLWDFASVMADAVELMYDLRISVTSDYDDKSLNFWSDDIHPLTKISEDKTPCMNRANLEDVVSRYLRLPYRCEAVDRLLTRTLVALEVFAFGNEMVNKKSVIFRPDSPFNAPHILVFWLRGQFWNALLFGGIAALAVWAGFGWFAAASIAIFVLLGIVSVVALPFGWRGQVKARSKILELLTAMTSLYTEMRSDGPISAQYIRERALEKAQLGVIWPAPLFAMLDDVIARTGRI
jgi:hypothetical protein